MINEIDIKHLTIIRNTVDNLLRSVSILNDKEDYLILDIAPHTYEGAMKFFKKAKVQTLDIDSTSNADYICDLADATLVPNNYFDIIFCTEVLEHTENPFKCVETMYRILKPNGKLYVTTPFDFRIHNPLPDNWRFTEHGLKILFKKFDSVIISEISNENRYLMPIQYTVEATKVDK
jgi:ubiquinone/menaquinone biosynthesis C-methylase UbiE